jgi:hypothetical protein
VVGMIGVVSSDSAGGRSASFASPKSKIFA